jgi:hypothetical protein
MEARAPSRSWLVRGRRATVVLLILLTLLFGARAILDAWMGSRLNDAIARIEKQYGPLRYDPVRKLDAWKKWPRRIAPDNRARLLDAAAASVTAGSEKAELALGAGTPAPKGDVAREIAEQNREAVRLAIEAAGLRHSNWEISWGAELSNVPNLLNHILLAKVLVATAQHQADAGRPDDAMAALGAGFSQAAAMGSEPASVMTVNAISKVGLQVNALKDILERSEPSGPALAALAAAIDENLHIRPAREALLGELKHTRSRWSLMERGWLWGARTVDHAVPALPTAWMRGLGWFLRPVIRHLAVRELADLARAVDAASEPRGRRAREFVPDDRQGLGALPSSRRYAAGLIDAGDRSNAQLVLTATAVALRRFRLDHGAYPASLDELAPSYLTTLPLDPFTDRPPEYSRDGAGFVLRARIPELPVPPGSHRVSGYRDPAEWKLTR